MSRISFSSVGIWKVSGERAMSVLDSLTLTELMKVHLPDLSLELLLSLFFINFGIGSLRLVKHYRAGLTGF